MHKLKLPLELKADLLIKQVLYVTKQRVALKQQNGFQTYKQQIDLL